jgi:hypothetical protein
MNKRTLRITSSGLIVAAAYLLIRLAYVGTGPAQRSAAFVGLPVGRSVPIRFQLGEEVFDRFTDLEKRNQVRDWLMYTVMSEAGMETATLRKALYDVPPLRAHYLEPVAHFDYGETRSRSLGDGEIVAVVPKTSAAVRADQLADIADREYKNTGEMPKRVHVFEYDLDRESQSAHITQIESIPGRDLFQPAYGYVEAAIRSQADLAAFMQSVHELIAARTEGGVLHLAGRKRLGTPYRGLRLEDAAALWQSQREVQSANARVAAFEDKWKNTTYRTEFEKAQLETKYQRELAELKASMPHPE